MKLLRFSILITFLMLTATETWAENLLQGHHRWRNDDGDESSATWKEALETTTTVGPGYNFRLRIEVVDQAPHSPTPETFYLAYYSPGGSWTQITSDGSTNAFKLSPSENFANGDVTTDQLPNNFDLVHGNLGIMIESSSDVYIESNGGESMEYEWCLQATSHAVNNETYYFGVSYYSSPLPLPDINGSAILTYDQSLPVELAAFTAQQQGKNVLLNWTTASETDNLGFILERRANGAQWQTIASYQTEAALQGKGNSTTNTSYTYTDTQAPQNLAYEYRLSDVDIHGAVSHIGATQINVAAIPTAFSLEPAYPNPFNPSTNIRFHLAQDGLVKLTVLDMLGRAVKTIDNAWLPAGTCTRTWNAMNNNNQPVPSGVYFLRLEAANTNLIQKAVLIR